MPLTPGARLGPYEIVAPLGAGGMGEVYKARDSRLDRLVAIKIVSGLLVGSAELRQRFDREAKTISQLNHPNICAVHDVGHDAGTDYLVLEFVEGETLAARIARGALDPAEALTIAIQIGSALDTAHRHGVIHRDLKPANVMLTKAGAKLLDFGLAKMGATASALSGAALSAPPTVTTPITTRGTILGTFQYLAPEQIEGAEADPRSDIWSFGCVLYEMLTGRRAFDARSHASLIGAILKDQPPPVSAMQPLASPALEQVVRRCLAKDPDERWQTARDLVLQLKWIQEGSAAGVPAVVARRRRSREGLAWTLAALATLTAAAILAYYIANQSTAPPSPSVSFTMQSPEGTAFGPGVATVAPFPAFSPDGRAIVFIGQRPGEPPRLWVRFLDAVDARELQGTDNAQLPFWSPDSRSVAFFADNKLKRVEVTGGAPQIICEATQPEPASWSAEGVILFVSDRAQGLASVPAAGGQPRDVLDVKSAGVVPTAPSFLPDGRRFLFYARGAVYLASLDGGPPRRLMASDSRGEYARPGFVLFMRGQTLFAQPFDADRGELLREAIPLADGIRLGRNGRVAFSASQTGALVYRRGGAGTEAQLTWYSPAGKELGTVAAPASMNDLALSPDGRRLAAQKREADGADIWVFDLERNTASRLTIDPASETHPVWSPDGRTLIYSSVRDAGGVYRKAASGVGTEELVLKASEARPHSWSADGRTVLFDAGGDVWIGTVGRLDSAKPFLANGAYSEMQARLSPDERYVAYVSTESGRGELYVASYPDLAERWMVTTGGASAPLWSRDGTRLYYVAGPDVTAGTSNLVVVDVEQRERQLRFSAPKSVLSVLLGPGPETYAVAPDGRILVARALRLQTAAEPLVVVLNWSAKIPAR